jgi:hypothetical protein
MIFTLLDTQLNLTQIILIHFLCISSFFSSKSGLKCITNFLFDSEFDSERISAILCNLRPPVKIVDFQGEVSFISVFDGIRYISGAWFITQLVSTVQIYIDHSSNAIFTIQM